MISATSSLMKPQPFQPLHIWKTSLPHLHNTCFPYTNFSCRESRVQNWATTSSWLSPSSLQITSRFNHVWPDQSICKRPEARSATPSFFHTSLPVMPLSNSPAFYMVQRSSVASYDCQIYQVSGFINVTYLPPRTSPRSCMLAISYTMA